MHMHLNTFVHKYVCTCEYVYAVKPNNAPVSTPLFYKNGKPPRRRCKKCTYKNVNNSLSVSIVIWLLTTDVAFFSAFSHVCSHFVVAGCTPRNGTKHLHNNKRTPSTKRRTAFTVKHSELGAQCSVFGVQRTAYSVIQYSTFSSFECCNIHLEYHCCHVCSVYFGYTWKHPMKHVKHLCSRLVAVLVVG